MSEKVADGGENESHPLVGLLFWMMGKNLGENDKKSSSNKVKKDLTQDEIDAGQERIQRRSLSWKDENSNELLETWHEFADVKGPDMPLSDEKPSNPSLKAGTTLDRSKKVALNEEEEERKRYSPNANSPNWGFFVSITPDNDIFPSGSSNGGSSKSSSFSSAPASQNNTPKASASLALEPAAAPTSVSTSVPTPVPTTVPTTVATSVVASTAVRVPQTGKVVPDPDQFAK